MTVLVVVRSQRWYVNEAVTADMEFASETISRAVFARVVQAIEHSHSLGIL